MLSSVRLSFRAGGNPAASTSGPGTSATRERRSGNWHLAQLLPGKWRSNNNNGSKRRLKLAEHARDVTRRAGLLPPLYEAAS
jgi:hypothetical protein